MKLVATLCLALGVATTVAGSMSYAFGMSTTDVVNVVGLGPLNGLWEPADYCFLGTILAAVGAGITTFSLVWFALLFRHGQAIWPRRRWLVWSLVLALAVAGVGTGAVTLWSRESPRLTRNDVVNAKMQVAILLTLLADGKDTKAMTTPDYQRREAAQKRSDKYDTKTINITSTELHNTGHITLIGTITAAGKTTELRLDNGILVGGGAVVQAFPKPKEIGFTARLVKSDNGHFWLVDELVFQEE